jgi:hypothetical protein
MAFLVPDDRAPEIAPATAPQAGIGDRFAAQFGSTALEMDSWGRKWQAEKKLLDELGGATGLDLSLDAPAPGA